MMTSPLRAVCISLVLAGSAGCSSSDSAPSDPATASFFLPGHGVRELQRLFDSGNGTSRYYITGDVTLSEPGKLEWVYGLTSQVGDSSVSRRTVDVATGATLAEQATTKGVYARSLTETRALGFVPYTNKLFNLVKNASFSGIDGDIYFRDVSATTNFHPYANGDILHCYRGGYYSFPGMASSSDLTGSFRASDGTVTPISYHHQVPFGPESDPLYYRATAFERGADGDFLALSVSGAAVVVRSVRDDKELATLPFDGLSEMYVDPQFPLPARSKLSADGSRATVLVYDQLNASAVPKVTTFLYEVATHGITLVLRDVQPDHLTATFFETADFDEDGNLYFAANIDPVATTGLQLLKQSASGQSVVATGFVPNTLTGIPFIKAVGGKIFLGIGGGGSANTTKLSEGPAYVLGVVD